MPLFERARIEVYVPDLPHADYRNLLTTLKREFTYTFGGCTMIGGLDGNYLSGTGLHIQDHVNLIYTDAHHALEANSELMSTYADKLRDATFSVLMEDAILVAVSKIFHAD